MLYPRFYGALKKYRLSYFCRFNGEPAELLYVKRGLLINLSPGGFRNLSSKFLSFHGILLCMRPRVYIETSVVSYLTSRSSRDLVVAAHQELTRQWRHERAS
jgi:hypothetical protein